MSETMQIGLHRQTLSAQIYETLEAKILAGDLRPGTRLSEESLAERFGVSRAPVREALAALQRAGLAEKSGARDRMVAVPNATLIAQKYDLWWVVDVGRTYLASLEATPAECDALEALVTAADEAVKSGDAATYRDLVARFHEGIRAACKNPYISEIAEGCDIHLRWFEALYDRHAEICAVAVQEHAQILAAFRARDFTALSDSIRTHMLRQRDNILRLFETTPYPRAVAAAAD